ncbi:MULTISPECIES: serine/threonine phosphatase [unclassified Moorena]|uniref:serine/threonine phosphatase n=1 Tax=unclassified Moorena TaxID=2683338 RepID=UPI0013BF63E6|nr:MULTISPECIES: serine/threonine phosphatase [unclassified Moorena]NEO07980.1 serine/threonine phosphatase [Moorena sp. SIO3I8]NEO20113.1 serine/threonine phosphatase [Moorena sp. SIO4A5]NEP20685.1 serine/threonine phosphatase [Moorena sp. SIO3I6]NEQ57232.1 serine/threonine phosphatase [Moorena sp. SIO4A1]
MLVCPQCQFENPNTNKFCQRCGTSLTDKTCHECASQVPLNAETCHNCGAFTGTVWRAIISKQQNSATSPQYSPQTPVEVSESSTDQATAVAVSQPESDQTERELTQPASFLETRQEWLTESDTILTEPGDDGTLSQASTVNADEASINNRGGCDQVELESGEEPLLEISPIQKKPQSTEASTWSILNLENPTSETATIVYLDQGKRYRVLEPEKLSQIGESKTTDHSIFVTVLDCQPLQKSPLETLINQTKLSPEKFDISTTQEQPKPSSKENVDVWKVLDIPQSAKPYLALKDLCYPSVPEIHDVWQQNGKAIILLENRSEWQLLSKLWGSEEFSKLQILYWLDEMAKLWQALEPWHCRQSLLELTNLRVDEDQALGLERLYPDMEENPLTLEDLGQLWQRLFNESQRTQFTSLSTVVRQLCTKEIETIEELRSHLQGIADEQESDPYESGMELTEAVLSEMATADTEPPDSQELLSDLPGKEQQGDDMPTVLLPMSLQSLDDLGSTDIGHQRDHNEDCFGIETQLKKQENPIGRTIQARGLYILCDGMGGHAAGEVASSMAVEVLQNYFKQNWQDEFPTEDSLRKSVYVTNQAIFDINQQNARSGSGRMGTTLVMMLIQNTKVGIVHVGDSRVYRLTRKRGLEQITIDHEVGQREIQHGVDPELAYSRPDAYQLTQALGPRSEQFLNPDVQFIDIAEDTIFLLCSDGLSDNDLLENHWQTHLAPLLSSRASLDQGLANLIELANEHNGHDNITLILVRVKVRPNLAQPKLH